LLCMASRKRTKKGTKVSDLKRRDHEATTVKSMMSSVRRAARLDDAPRTATVPGTLLEQAASGRVFIETWTPNGGCFRVTFGEMADCMLAAASVLSALDVKKADYVALVRQFIQAPTLPCVACFRWPRSSLAASVPCGGR
jgi:hypothetical protein